MLLCIDVGNTNTVLGLYDGDTMIAHWRIATDRAKTADEYVLILQGLLALRGLKLSAITDIALASVVPPLNNALNQLARRHLNIEPLVVTNETETGITIGYSRPEEVGADRIVNAVGVMHKHRLPAIVVDFGTATTFDVVSKDGVYVGGAISPGLSISTQALFERAARLPRIQIVPPKHAIGRNTVESMQAGILFGAAGGVDETVRRLSSEIEGDPIVVATGGLASVVAELSQTIDLVDEHLTLDGLRYIFNYQRQRAAR